MGGGGGIWEEKRKNRQQKERTTVIFDPATQLAMALEIKREIKIKAIRKCSENN